MPEAIHLYQKQAYMNARKEGLSQEVSSTIAEISARTGQRIDSDTHRPNRAAVRTQPHPKDPLSAVWASELEPMLRAEPRLKPMTLFEYLEEKYPGVLRDSGDRRAGDSG